MLTVIDVHLVLTTLHGGSVITQGQLAEGRETGGAHPYMERFPLMDVWDRDIVAVLGVHHAPIWWRDHLIDSVGGLLVQIAITCPCGTICDHSIVDGLGVVARVQQAWRAEGVVEERVCDQTARIVCLTVFTKTQGVTVAVGDGVVINKVSFELILVERLDIATVVLVEVCELIVEEDGRGQVVRDVEAQGANGRVDVDKAVMVGDCLVAGAPLRNLRGGSGILEVARDVF